MKSKLLFMTTVVLLLGCSNKDSINASDQYVGTYETTVQISASYPDRGITKNSSTTATISFKKVSATNLTLTDTWGDHYVALAGSGPEFGLPQHSVTGSILGVKDIFMRHGDGKFDGNNITMTTYTVNDGTNITAVYTGTKK